MRVITVRKKAALALTAVAALATGIAVTAERAQAAEPNTTVRLYLTTNGAPAGAGDFEITTTVGTESFAFHPSTVNNSITFAGSQDSTTAGVINVVVSTSASGLVTNGVTQRLFFVKRVYCTLLNSQTSLGVGFTLDPGAQYNCFVELDKVASMTLTKQVVHGPDTWTYEFGLDNSTSVAADDGFGYPSDLHPSATWDFLVPGAQYSVTEYDEDGGNYPTWVDVDCGGDGDGTFTPAVGETINCTATNYYGIPLTITKTARGGDDTFDFTLTGPNLETSQLSLTTTTGSTDGIGNGTTGTTLTTEGQYLLTETDQDEWYEGGINCTVTHQDDSTSDYVNGFTVARGDSVECSVVNQHTLDVSMTKTVTGDTAPLPGGTTQYTMVVTNNSTTSWASGLALVDDLPAHLVPTDSPTPGCDITGQELVCKLPPLAPGASTTVVVNVQVAADAPVPVSLANTAAIFTLGVDALDPTQVASSQAVIPHSGANTTLLAELALATLAAGIALLTFTRRRTALR